MSGLVSSVLRSRVFVSFGETKVRLGYTLDSYSRPPFVILPAVKMRSLKSFLQTLGLVTWLMVACWETTSVG